MLQMKLCMDEVLKKGFELAKGVVGNYWRKSECTWLSKYSLNYESPLVEVIVQTI